MEVCIFNIGPNVNFPLLETTERVFHKVWELACYAGFLAGREAARLMLPRGRGNIFFTGGTASLRGRAGYAAFASAKFGLRAVAQSAARDGETMTKVEFHFDFGSPDAYLAHLVIPQIERRTGAKFEYVPVLLGGVFKLTGNRSRVESLADVKNKPEYERLKTACKRHKIANFRHNPLFPR